MSNTGAATAFSWLGDCCLRIGFGDTPSESTLACVRLAFEKIRNAHLDEVADLTPAYHTLLVRFHARAELDRAEPRLRALIDSTDGTQGARGPRLVEIPVCYEMEFAPDIEQVAAHCGLKVPEVVSRHSAATYTVAFIGFAPGFPYLAGLPPRLHAPRLEQPRTRVPAGSIGIAGDQAGIYPLETPGGWRLIGRTPLRLFDASRAAPSLLTAGDKVRFNAVSASQFRAIDEKEYAK